MGKNRTQRTAKQKGEKESKKAAKVGYRLMMKGANDKTDDLIGTGKGPEGLAALRREKALYATKGICNTYLTNEAGALLTQQ